MKNGQRTQGLELEQFADLPYANALKAFRRWYVRTIIMDHDRNMSRAARHAGMDRSAFRRLARMLEVWTPGPAITPRRTILGTTSLPDSDGKAP